MPAQGRQGTNTGTVYSTPQRRRRRAAARAAQDKRWAAKAGPVTVRRVDETGPDPAVPAASEQQRPEQ